MFGARHCELTREGHWAGGRRWRPHFGGDFAGGGRHGMGGGEMMRAGRMLAQGDLRLILALLSEQPRHGYELIKLLEDDRGRYSPSPGRHLSDADLSGRGRLRHRAGEGAKKLYPITEEGRGYLEENRSFVDAVLDRLTAIGEKATRIREHFDRPEYAEQRGRRRGREEAEEGSAMPPLVRAALDNLREIASKRLEADEEAETRIVETLMRVAQELKKM